MSTSIGPGIVTTRFHIGMHHDNFFYTIVPENHQMYQCRRNLGLADSPSHYVLYILKSGSIWFAVEGPQMLPTGRRPSADYLLHHGILRFECLHTPILNGVHRWYKFEPDKSLILSEAFLLATTVFETGNFDDNGQYLNDGGSGSSGGYVGRKGDTGGTQ
jgi:hypothetical protein